jgi:hypothetical protein
MSGRGRGRPRNECSPEVVGKEGEESLDPDKGSMPEKKVGSFLDLELPGTVLRGGGGDAGPGPLNFKKSHLEPSRDGGDMRKDREAPIRDMMQEDQWPTE